MKKFYVTTPIYYANSPTGGHLGHSYTSVAADVLARFKRLEGYDVHFVTGTDEHGQKVEQAALKADSTPQEFVDGVAKEFKYQAALMNIKYDDFIRTTEPRHKLACRVLWERLVAAGTIYLGEYEGWYSSKDESFYSELEIEKIGNNFIAKETGSVVEKISEPSYFFELIAFKDRLIKYFETHPDFIQPISKMNEIYNILKSENLTDISISRTKISWGILVPGDPKHVMYVWFDALVNYLTAVGFPDLENPNMEYWEPDVHIVGKEIVKFHAIYWVAFLMAADLKIPKKIFSHGWWTVDGKKMSKSDGNFLNISDILGVDWASSWRVDSLRYFMLREMPFGNDGNFSQESFHQKYNSDLANDLGNLAQRCLVFVEKSTDGTIIIPEDYTLVDYDLVCLVNHTISSVRECIDRLDFYNALIDVWKLVSAANGYFVKNAPWKLLKDCSLVRMNDVLYLTIYALRAIAILLYSFMPESMDKLLFILGIKNSDYLLSDFYKQVLKINDLPKPEIIFPKISVDKNKETLDGIV